VRVAPDERPELGDGYEAREVVHLRLRIPPRLFEPAEIEQFCAIVHLCPEALGIQASGVQAARVSADNQKLI
jgi:hypothetical protein